MSAEANSQLEVSGQSIPKYDPGTSLPKAYRRPRHDNFKPPNGPPLYSPASIEYEQEVGLESGQKIFVEKQSVTYGDQKHQPVGSLPVNVCHDAGIIKATTNRALSKPHGCVLYACGNNGKHGSIRQTGQTGSTGSNGSSGNRGGGHGADGERGGPGGPGTVGERGIDGTDASDVKINIWGDACELNVDGTSQFTAKLGGPKAEEVLFINCRGGDGGHGG